MDLTVTLRLGFVVFGRAGDTGTGGGGGTPAPPDAGTGGDAGAWPMVVPLM